MGLEEIIAKLCCEESVKAAFLLEGEFYSEVIDEESSVVESSMGMPLINRALEEVIKRETAVCIFCSSTFEVPTDHVMLMEDKCGNVVGHDVPPCMINDFKDNPEIFWLSDDFAIYPDRTKNDIMFVLLPHKVRSIGEKEGARDPILLYPATTTDIMLRKHFRMSLDDPRIATAILAFNAI
ncbi:MAG: hypothetical protein LBG63_04510 [Candidatus Methanoplasma sp.]|jgi:hypothetical protein|nr:hypothetical protein [Candidatus Methanoplasma sp.]